MSAEGIHERDLIAASTQGSQIAYRELIRLHQDAVYCFAWALIGEEHAQRVTEDAFLTAWRQLSFFRSFHLSFRDRLLQLVCIDCAALARRGRRSLPSGQDEASFDLCLVPKRYDPRTNMEHLALQTDVEYALQALPFRFREIYLLHELGNLADTQIADLLQEPAQTIHADLGRARGFVRRHILQSGGFFPLSETEQAKNSEKVMACKDNIPTLAAAAEDLCTGAEKQVLSAHFATCPGCRAYYESLCAIHHSIAILRHDAPCDLTPYIISRIQQDAGHTPSEPVAEEKKRWAFRPAVGRFTIIALCIALVLLAYSGRTGQPDSSDAEANSPQQSTAQQTTPEDAQPSQPQDTPSTPPAVPAAPTEPAPAPEENGAGSETEENDAPPPADTPEADDASDDSDQNHRDNSNDDNNDDSTGSADGDPNSTDENREELSGSIVPGGTSTSSTLIPEGETYAALYLTEAAAQDILARFCILSFRATMTDGTNMLYYVLPAASDAAAAEALAEANLSCEAYSQPDTLDSAAPTVLYLLPLS